MKRRKPTEAERLARHNEEMRFALANNCTLIEARTRLARIRWAEFEERQAAELERVRRCGTGERRQADTPSFTTAPSDEPAPHYWWQDL